MNKHDSMTVGDVAARSGFATSALRFYEAEGLISAARTSGGQRRFERSALRRLAFIRAATNVGLSLDEIRAELERLPDGRSSNKADWQQISTHWRGRLNEQIDALERLRDGLDGCIGCGCLSLAACSIFNPQDELANSSRAPGAARLPARLRRASTT